MNNVWMLMQSHISWSPSRAKVASGDQIRPEFYYKKVARQNENLRQQKMK